MQAINSSDAVAPQQGTGFTRLKDPSQMRMVLIVEAVARSGWEATFGAENPPNEGTEAVGVWEARPFSVKVKGSNNYLYRRSREMAFRPEAAKQILGEGVRRSLRLPELVDHVCDETSRTALRIGALEALWVQNERGGCRFLLAVHAVAGTPQIGAVANVSERAAAAGTLESGVAGTPGNAGTPAGCSPDYPSLFRTLRWREKFPEFASTLTRILETHGGCPAGSVVFPGASAECPSDVPSIFTITWVPRAETAAWILASDVGSEDPRGRFRARHPRYREDRGDIGRAFGARAGKDDAARWASAVGFKDSGEGGREFWELFPPPQRPKEARIVR